VATGLVLQVVEPHLNGPGGEVPIIGYSAGEAGEFVIDGQGVAPAAATLKVFSSLGIDLVPGNGLLPAMVPGAFGAWMLLLQRYGSLGLREVMRHAIGYAADGYPMLPGASAAIDAMSQTFTTHWPTSA
jgi:gamma-glutamyltranspeptidase/glutathione hydrolase